MLKSKTENSDREPETRKKTKLTSRTNKQKNLNQLSWQAWCTLDIALERINELGNSSETQFLKHTQEYDDKNTGKGIRNRGCKIRRSNTCKLEYQKKRRQQNTMWSDMGWEFYKTLWKPLNSAVQEKFQQWWICHPPANKAANNHMWLLRT